MQQSRDVAKDMLKMIRRVTVIYNPVAGGGEDIKKRYELETYLSRAVRNLHDIVSWRIEDSTGPGHAEKLARDAARAGVNIIVAAGGDGTINEVLNGMIGYESRLGIVPTGTGNDFARTIGVGLTIKEAVLNVFYGDPVTIDVGKMGEKYFLNIAGCGFDAIIAERVNNQRGRLKGRSAYVAAVFQSLKEFQPVPIRLTVDGETRELNSLLCAVANARCYGGGMKIAPDALVNDGLFDICVVNTGKWDFVRSFPKVFRGTHTTHPGVLMLRGKTVKIEAATELPLLIDGESAGTTPAEFSIVPNAITILGPEREPGFNGSKFGFVDTEKQDW
jgi:diacylglycerol kinase (ATP)